jgi:hypothetical protein
MIALESVGSAPDMASEDGAYLGRAALLAGRRLPEDAFNKLKNTRVCTGTLM